VTNEWDIELRVVSDPRYLCVVRAAISAAAGQSGFDDDQCGRVCLAVDEAVTNVIRHGYDSDTSQPVWVRFKARDERGRPGLTVSVEDRGRQIEPEQIRGRELSEVRPGGLGVHIIREVMDRVHYEKREGGGMRLTMSKAAVPTDQRKRDQANL
jgi:anti-sigma regulatory factor (Ser/Thr protein kinase)